MTTAYLALGANLGDRRRNINDAVEMLRATAGVRVIRISSLIETPAVGGPDNSPPFLNGAARIETDLSPTDLLNRLLEIERLLGRERREKWGPRLIDLDLLLYDDQIIEAQNLKIPHPLMQGRRFVLQPLAQIAPDVRHPILKILIAEMLERLPDGSQGA